MIRIRKSEKNENLSDVELIDLYKAKKNLEVLAILYNRYAHLVYGVCLKYLKNRQDSEDASMQIFEKLITEIQKFEIKNFKSWLHVVSKNYCLMKLRSFKTKSEFDETFYSSIVMEYEESMHHKDEVSIDDNLNALEKCMESLPETQKKCLELFYLKEKSYKEIVQLVDYEIKEVKSYIQNGKRNVKNCIEKKIGK